MNQHKILNVKLSNSQLFKLKSGIKTGTEVTLNLSSTLIDDSNNETNFPHKLLLTCTQVPRLRKPFVNDSSGITNLSKAHLSKTVQLGGFLVLFNPFGINWLSEIPNLIPKSIVEPFGHDLVNKDIFNPKKDLKNNMQYLILSVKKFWVQEQR